MFGLFKKTKQKYAMASLYSGLYDGKGGVLPYEYNYYARYPFGSSSAFLPTYFLQSTALFSTVKHITSAIATLPIQIVNKEGFLYSDVERNINIKNEIERLIEIFDSPNEFYETRYVFYERIASSLVLDGNAYLIPYLDNRGNLTELKLALPQSVTILADGTYQLDLEYENQTIKMRREAVLHLRLNNLYQSSQHDTLSLRGVPPITLLSTTIDISKKSDSYISQFFSNSSNGEIFLTAPSGLMQDNQASQMINKMEQFRRQSKSTLLLPDGVNVTIPRQKTAQDKNLAELRNQQIKFFASAYGIPAELCGVGEVKSVEQTNRLFHRYCLMSYITVIEQALTTFLPYGYYAKFDMNQFLRGDTRTTLELVREGLGGSQGTPFLTRNMALRLLGLTPVRDAKFDEVLDAAIVRARNNEMGGEGQS